MLENLIYFDFNFNNNINNYVSINIQGGLGNQNKLIYKYI